jgi:hypothetical protein
MLGVFPKEQSTAAAGQSSSMDRIDAAKLKLDARGGARVCLAVPVRFLRRKGTKPEEGVTRSRTTIAWLTRHRTDDAEEGAQVTCDRSKRRMELDRPELRGRCYAAVFASVCAGACMSGLNGQNQQVSYVLQRVFSAKVDSVFDSCVHCCMAFQTSY